MAVNFPNLFSQATNLRNDARVDEAIAAYEDIAVLAEQDGEVQFVAQALHMAGVSAKEAVIGKNSYFTQAFQFFAAAEKYYRQINDKVGLGALYRDMAITSDYANDLSSAVSFFQKSIEILNQTDAFEHLGITYDKLGLHFYKLKQYDTALQHVEKALELFRKAPLHGFFRATTLFDKARILFKKGDLPQALEIALESHGWFYADHGEEKHDRRRAQLSGLLAILYANLGEDKKAAQYTEEYRRLAAAFHPLAYKVVQSDLDELTQP